MIKETQSKHRYQTRSKSDKRNKKNKEDERLRKKRDASSDSDSSDSDWISEEETYEQDEFDLQEYRNFLAKMFPSSYSTQKAKDTPDSQYKRPRKVGSPVQSDEGSPRASKRSRKKSLSPKSSETEKQSENVILETSEKSDRTSCKKTIRKLEEVKSEEEDEVID